MSEVEARTQPAQEARAGRAGRWLGRGGTLPPRSRAHLGAHTQSRARVLVHAPLTGTPAHTPVPTCAHSHTCTNQTRRHTHPENFAYTHWQTQGVLRHPEPTVRTAPYSLAPLGASGPRAELTVPPPSRAPFLARGSPGPDHRPRCHGDDRSYLPPPPRPVYPHAPAPQRARRRASSPPLPKSVGAGPEGGA